jgi:hypothetical protein
MLATLKRYTPSSTCGVRASSRHGSPRIVAPYAIADEGDIAARVSAIVSLLCIFAVSTRLGAGGYALVFLCSPLAPFRVPASGVRESRTRALRSCDSRSISISIASLAGNVCSSASSSSPSRWASALEEALCGLCSIGMICKTSFNAFQSILYARLDEMADAQN